MTYNLPARMRAEAAELERLATAANPEARAEMVVRAEELRQEATDMEAPPPQ